MSSETRPALEVMPDGGEDFVEDLETVVFGCHRTSGETIKGIFESAGIYTFFFSEYFLDAPVALRTTDKNALESRLNSRYMYFPFLQRAAMELKFYVNSSGKRKRVLASKTSQVLATTRELSRIAIPLREWRSQRKRIVDHIISQERLIRDDIIHGREGIKRKQGEWKNGTDRWQEAMRASYDVQLHLWLQAELSKESPLFVLRCPISSCHTFYGQFVTLFQANDRTEASALKDRINAALYQLARERYVPILTLLHVSKWERILYQRLDKSSFLDEEESPSPLQLNWQNSSDEIEAAFGKLWENRQAKWLSDRLPTEDKVDKLKTSIILNKYHIASPSMIEQIINVVRGAALMKESKKGDPLPSALVFGEAGSGKDKMARLIATLTKDFWDSEPRVHNMAAIKPSLLAVPLMMGVEHKDFRASGIFNVNVNSALEPSGTPDKTGETASTSKQVLILDELNSLDYDMQGSLLRLLENSEIAPLFSASEPKFVNALVIGVVNEDPDHVTREAELRLLDNAKEFLGQAEVARLYEAFHRARRLRPDLVYRLKRGVYVRMPPLRKRREDIPLIFKHSCTPILRELVSNILPKGLSLDDIKVKVNLDLDTYDLLMRRDFTWPGNIRQLQAVANKTVNSVWTKWRGTPHSSIVKGINIVIEIERAHVETALREEFKELFEGVVGLDN